MTQPLGPATILVVEDDAATSEFFVDLLSWNGYHSAVAASGEAAFAALAAHGVQLVLLDHRLPDMDGLAVCRQIRATISTTMPILLLSADRAPVLRLAAQAAGITAYLPKPVDPEILLDQIATLIH
ncbi:MAG: response regulator [Chloroflexales bacterium]|nr:response regulator [Chloroflexales bacterium]